jgi:hypothetical protein
MIGDFAPKPEELTDDVLFRDVWEARGWAAWQIAKALGISAREQLARFELFNPCTTWRKGKPRSKFCRSQFPNKWRNFL